MTHTTIRNIKTTILRAILCISFGTLAFAWQQASAQDVAPMKVTVKADTAALVMGDRTTIEVEVLKNRHEGALLDMPKPETDYHGVELTDWHADSTELGNNRIQLTYHITFQAFDPDQLVTLPPFRYASAGDTAASSILTLKVLPVELSPELGDPQNPDSLTIHADAPVQAVKSKWYDIIPDEAIWVLLAIVVAALAVVAYKLYKKNGPAFFKPRKPTPPYELAIQRMLKLKKQQLIEKGLSKQFFTSVTDIWRQYLQGRFGINAMEMTSKQILRSLRANPETHLTVSQMEQLLQLSDFVKFAAMNSSKEEMVNTYNTIYSFIESTRPAPEPEDEAKESGKAPAAK